MTVTIRDVAQAAGVSIATVSRALSSSEHVASSTRQHVHRVAKELGYRRVSAGRPARTSRTGCIGLVVPDIENPHFGTVCSGVHERARASGYTLLIANTDEDITLETQSVRTLAQRVDGVILASPRGDAATIQELASSTPMVLLNRAIDGVTSFNLDHEASMVGVLSHLVALGHRRIAFAGGPSHAWSQQQRLAAFDGFGDREGVELVHLGNFAPTFTSGLQVADLALASGCAAVIAYNDLMALGVIDRLHQRGVRVPEDMSVAGFDNIPAATMIWPKLTTVEYPRTQIGRYCVDALLEQMSDVGEEPTPDIEATSIPIQLVVRGSTGVAPGVGTGAPPTRRVATSTTAAE